MNVCVLMCVWMCVCMRYGEIMCVCIRKRERETDSVCLFVCLPVYTCVHQSECVSMYLCVYEREWVLVCVCLGLREKDIFVAIEIASVRT